MAEDNVKKQILEAIAGLLTAAFGLIAALAWNEAIKAFISQYLSAGSALTGLFVYAILITIIAVLVTVMIGRALGRYGLEISEDKKL
jgi:ABC-type multidrug transport system fused ATPase/permease subunit